MQFVFTSFKKTIYSFSDYFSHLKDTVEAGGGDTTEDATKQEDVEAREHLYRAYQGKGLLLDIQICSLLQN